jgi:hypothetical protein
MKFLMSIIVLIILLITNSIIAQNNTKIILNVSADKAIVESKVSPKKNFRLTPLKFEIGKIKEGKTTIVFKDITVIDVAIASNVEKKNKNKMDFQQNKTPMGF